MNSDDSYQSEVVLRYGILERLEISALVDYEYVRSYFPEEVIEVGRLSSPSVRARVNLIEEQKGLIPTLAIQGGAVLPVGLGDQFYVSNRFLPFGRAMLGYHFLKIVDLTLNYHVYTIEVIDELLVVHQHITNLSIQVTEEFGIMAEMVGIANLDDHPLFMDYGLFYLINNDLQIDINSGSQGLNTSTSTFFINAGVSWRMRL